MEKQIKNKLFHFAQFYGGECYFSGEDKKRALPDATEWVNIYAKEILELINNLQNNEDSKS